MKKGIEAVLSFAEVDLCDFGMSTFREYVGLDRKVPALKGHIYISAIQDDSDKITHYVFEYRSADEGDVIEEKSTTGAIRTRISKIKNSK